MYLFFFFFLTSECPLVKHVVFFFRFTFDSEFQTLAQRCQTINNFLFFVFAKFIDISPVCFFCVWCVCVWCVYVW